MKKQDRRHWRHNDYFQEDILIRLLFGIIIAIIITGYHFIHSWLTH